MAHRFLLLALVALSGLALSAPTASEGAAPRASAASTSPAARVAAAGAAIARNSGFHVAGTATDADGSSRIVADVRRNGAVQLALVQKGQRIEFRRVSGKVYLKAPAAFWRTNGSAAAAKLFGGKWVTGSAKELGGVELSLFTPKVIGTCLSRQTGTLRDAGTGAVGGKRVRIVRDLGDKPGVAPGKLSIAASGTPFPLRIQQTGEARPGGKPDRLCDDGEKDTTTAQDVRFSGFGATTPIEKPAGALDLSALAGGEPTTTS